MRRRRRPPGWNAARYEDAFQAKEPSPEKMKLSKANDGPVWGDDGFEIFLFPPSVENAYAHIAVNALGTVY